MVETYCIKQDPNTLPPDIRDVALVVNDRLKKLILPEDDEDQTMDTVASLTVEGGFQTSGAKLGQSSPKLSPKSAVVSTSTGSSSTTSTEANAVSSKTGQSSPKSGRSSPTTTLEPPPSGPSGMGSSSHKLVSSIQEPPKLHLLGVLGVLISHMKFTLQETRTETLRWLMWLHQQLPKRVCLCVVQFAIIKLMFVF